MALCPGLPRWAGTRKVKPIWILLKQETVSGSGISWAICKSAPCSGQITTPAPHHSVFYRPDALPATQPTVSKHRRHSWFSEFTEIDYTASVPITMCYVLSSMSRPIPDKLRHTAVRWMQQNHGPVWLGCHWCTGRRCWQSLTEVVWHWQCPCHTHKHSTSAYSK